MCTAEQYRAKAIEYSKLVGTASGAGELRRLRGSNEASPNRRKYPIGNRASGPDNTRQRARSRTVQAAGLNAGIRSWLEAFLQ